MTLFKRGKIWWARVYHDGKEGVRSTKIRATSKAEEARAKAVAKELYKKVLSGEFVITDSRGIRKPAEAGSTDLTFAQYSHRWLEEHAHRYERATLEGIRTALAEALPVLGPQIMARSSGRMPLRSCVGCRRSSASAGIGARKRSSGSSPTSRKSSPTPGTK